MEENPLLKLQSLGQSVWIDFVRRGMLSPGELQHLIEEDGVQGVTSNPSIFEKAIAGSHDYDDAIRAQGSHPATGPRGGSFEGKTAAEIYQALTVEDIQRAADLFRPVYDRMDGRDGFVSLEVPPHLAYDTAGTIDEARRLWAALDRPNVLIKVPATRRAKPVAGAGGVSRQLLSQPDRCAGGSLARETDPGRWPQGRDRSNSS